MENQQLWRSLKAMGAAGGSPRPPTSRQNSDGGKSLGSGVERMNGSSFSAALRRGPSTEGRQDATSTGPRNQLDAPPAPSPFSTPSRTPAATPPLNSSSRLPSRAASHASLRKAASLDLGRPQPEEPRGSMSSELPRTPPPPLSQTEQSGTGRLPYSASMPTIASSERPLHPPDRSVAVPLFPVDAFLRCSPSRRLLPQLAPLAPVSPLYAQQHQDNLSPSSARERASSFSAPSPTYPDQQLYPPQSAETIRRNRTPSNNSTSSSAGSPTPSQVPGPPTAALPVVPTGSTPSNLSSYPSPPPQGPQSSASPTLSSPLAEVPPLQYSSRQHQPKESEPAHPSPSQRQPAGSGLTASSPRPTLSPAFLPFTRVRVASSTIKMNERSKEVISFLIEVLVSVPPESDPERQGGTAGWRVEKLYSEVLGLDATVKAKTSKQESKGIGALPDKSLLKDHAPHKSDQRKASSALPPPAFDLADGFRRPSSSDTSKPSSPSRSAIDQPSAPSSIRTSFRKLRLRLASAAWRDG